ncbi:MAG TPA: hypothetical protein VNG12_11825, partial [Acidimicrobiales bacterium]|nr:hypothetical protein [Acidimicrobiales bacterium]
MPERAQPLARVLRRRPIKTQPDSESAAQEGGALERDLGAVLDDAHVGDIQGAFGTIAYGDTGARRSTKAKLLTLLAIVGPGLIVMVGDN